MSIYFNVGGSGGHPTLGSFEFFCCSVDQFWYNLRHKITDTLSCGLAIAKSTVKLLSNDLHQIALAVAGEHFEQGG